MTMIRAKKVLEQLRAKVDAGDVKGGKSDLADMKMLMLDFPMGASNYSEYASIAASALEMGVLISVADQDLDAFARNVSQLKPYYATTPLSSPSSENATRKCHILGLNLMYLLVENNLSEFHAELELLSSAEASSPYLSFPINIERQLMVGSYDEVLSAGSRVPDPSYAFFMENLIQTVRDSIADCLEVSYEKMTIADAALMMKYDGEGQDVDEQRRSLEAYIEECRDDWIVEGDMLCFQPQAVGSKASDIPSMKLIVQSLSYATELERIV